MIKTRLTKPVMENEEGLNHLWIQFSELGNVKNVRLHLDLPRGIYRKRNLNGYPETNNYDIEIEDPLNINDIFIELFTSDPVICGVQKIVITVSYINYEGGQIHIEHCISLEVAPEDSLGELIIDEEVLTRIKNLTHQEEDTQENNYIFYEPVKIYQIDPHKISPLEKKYRIDY